MIEIDLKTAISRAFIESRKLQIILPQKRLRFRVKIAKHMWKEFADIEGVTDRMNTIAHYCQGISIRTLHDYRKADFNVDKLKSVQKRKEDATTGSNDDFEMYLQDAKGTNVYMVKVSAAQVAQMETVITMAEPKLKADDIAQHRLKLEHEQAQRAEEYFKPIAVAEREALAQNILLDYATGLVSLSDACTRNNVDPMDFHQWMLTSHVIKQMYKEAHMIGNFINSQKIAHLANAALVRILESGKMIEVKTTYDRQVTAFNPEGEFVATRKIETERPLRASELAMLKRIIAGDLNVNFADAVDDVENMTDEELEAYIRANKDKLM